MWSSSDSTLWATRPSYRVESRSLIKMWMERLHGWSVEMRVGEGWRLGRVEAYQHEGASDKMSAKECHVWMEISGVPLIRYTLLSYTHVCLWNNTWVSFNKCQWETIAELTGWNMSFYDLDSNNTRRQIWLWSGGWMGKENWQFRIFKQPKCFAMKGCDVTHPKVTQSQETRKWQQSPPGYERNATQWCFFLALEEKWVGRGLWCRVMQVESMG